MNDNITSRIKDIMVQYAISPANFADKIDVQRSSISHILSGRNKPSLEFVQKILAEYPEISPSWLLSGKGNMKNEPLSLKENPNTVKEDKYVTYEDKELFTNVITNVNSDSTEIKSDPETKTPTKRKDEKFSDAGKQIKKVILLYSDGRFEEFTP